MRTCRLSTSFHRSQPGALSWCGTVASNQNMSSRRARLAFSVVVAASGAVLCLALDHYWWSKQPLLYRGLPNYPRLRIAGASGAFDSASVDVLFVAIPFYVLAVLIVATRIRALAAALGAVAIAVLTTLEFDWANTTDSSTAGLAFVGAIQFGVPIAIATWGLDRLASRLRRHGGRSVEGHS
jgi:hypothetical protein